MLSRIALVAVVLTLPFAAAAATNPSGGSSSLISVPPDATLVGSATLDEIRAFPEMSRSNPKVQAQQVVGIEGLDRVFQTGRSYHDTVAYFDRQLKQAGYQMTARVETPSSIAWTVKRPDGTLANVVVRNTSPTTFEIAEAAGAAATVPQR